MTQFNTVLIAGATGNLGKRIAESFLHQKKFTVKILVRADNKDEKKQATANDLKAGGAEWAEANYEDEESLQKALHGVDLVVSAVSGPAVGDFQLRLIRAAKEAGVKRFAPSEFGSDIETEKFGFSVDLFRPKKQAREELKRLGLEYVIIETGFFYEFVFNPRFLVNLEKGTLQLGGDGKQHFYATKIGDIAKVVPDIATHPHSGNRAVIVQGDRLTGERLVEIIQEVTGKPVEAKFIPAEDLKALISQQQDHFARLALQLHLLVALGLRRSVVDDFLGGSSLQPNFQEFTHERLTSLKEYVEYLHPK